MFDFFLNPDELSKWKHSSTLSFYPSCEAAMARNIGLIKFKSSPYKILEVLEPSKFTI